MQITTTYKSVFRTGTSHLTAASSVKLTQDVTLSEISLLSIKCPYFDGHYLANLKKCKWLKKLSAYSVKDCALQGFELFFLWQNNFLVSYSDFKLEELMFFHEILTSATVGMIEKRMLFPGKFLV